MPAKKKTSSRKSTSKSHALSFNHAMVYSKDVARSLRFYRDLLGFKVVEAMDYGGRTVCARLRSAGSSQNE